MEQNSHLTVLSSCLRLQISTTENMKSFSLVDERVGHDAQLLHLSALLLRQVLHGLLGVEAGPAGSVAVDLPLVLPRLQRAFERLFEKKPGLKIK